MSWPLASHFSAMLQSPQVAFRDPRLQHSRIEKDQRNQPRPWAGAFAVVYKAFSPDDRRPFAVRVFTSESPERRERYELVAAYAKDHKPRCLVEFEYRDQSIRSAGDGKWYPVILMEWVQGETLFNWVRDRCREGNAEAVGFLADRWLDAVKELADAGIAHGDLQHGNVMVTPQSEIKLVDYDCMCVPALVGRRNLEVGVEPYQHPEPQRQDAALAGPGPFFGAVDLRGVAGVGGQSAILGPVRGVVRLRQAALSPRRPAIADHVALVSRPDAAGQRGREGA